MAKILVIRDEEFERLVRYSEGDGGWQSLCRSLVRRRVPHSDDVDDYIKIVEKDEKDMFG